MRNEEIETLLSELNGSGSDAEFSAIESLRATGKLPELLLAKYQRSRRWQERASCVYHSIKFASASQEAFDLGIAALNDRSQVVRYRAAMLLAVSQRREAVPHLQELIEVGGSSQKDFKAAVCAIESGNINLFVDREGSGMVALRLSANDC